MPKKGKKEDAAEESPDQAEWKNLKNEADRLHKLTKKEEHDFNEFQQQHEKVNYFWIEEKKKLEDLRARWRNKDREQQDLEEKHHVEIKLYKQRLKHLLHEQQYDISQKKAEAEMALKMAQDDDRETELDVKQDKRTQNIALKELELSHEEYIRGLKREHDQREESVPVHTRNEARQHIEARRGRRLRLKFRKLRLGVVLHYLNRLLVSRCVRVDTSTPSPG